MNAALEAGYLERFEVPGQREQAGAADRRPARRRTSTTGAIRAGLISRALAELGDERAERLIDDLRAFNDAWDAALGITPRDPSTAR